MKNLKYHCTIIVLVSLIGPLCAMENEESALLIYKTFRDQKNEPSTKQLLIEQPVSETEQQKLSTVQPIESPYTRILIAELAPYYKNNAAQDASSSTKKVEQNDDEKVLQSLEKRFLDLKQSTLTTDELHTCYHELDREAHIMVLKYFPEKQTADGTVDKEQLKNPNLFKKFVQFRGTIELETTIRLFQQRIDALKSNYFPLKKVQIKKAQEDYRTIIQDMESYLDGFRVVGKTLYTIPHAYQELEKRVLENLSVLGAFEDIVHSFDYDDDLD